MFIKKKKNSDGFERLGSKEIGGKFEGSDLSPDLKRGITFAILSACGNVLFPTLRT